MPRRSAMTTINETLQTKSPKLKVRPTSALEAKPAAPAKTRPRRMLAYRLESGAATKEVIMVPYNGETDFKDVWSYHDLASGFLKSGVHIDVKKVTHALATQNTGWDSAFIKKQNARHHSHAVFASVTSMHQGDTFKFVSVCDHFARPSCLFVLRVGGWINRRCV